VPYSSDKLLLRLTQLQQLTRLRYKEGGALNSTLTCLMRWVGVSTVRRMLLVGWLQCFSGVGCQVSLQ
jgi:hypothetical protein